MKIRAMILFAAFAVYAGAASELLKKYPGVTDATFSVGSNDVSDNKGWISTAAVADDALRITFRLDPARYKDAKPRGLTAALIPAAMQFDLRAAANAAKPVRWAATKTDGEYEALITLPEDQWGKFVFLVSAEIEPGWTARSKIRLAPSGAPQTFSGVYYEKEHVDEQPKPVSQTKPVLADDARDAAGVVVVRFIVEKDGSVAQVISSVGVNLRGAERQEIMDLSETCVKQWRYKPAIRNGKPVRCHLRSTVSFGMESEDAGKRESA